MTNEDRNRLIEYIKGNDSLYFNNTDQTVNGGPCASYVSTLITCGTRQKIRNSALILGINISIINSKVKILNNIGDLIRYTQIGDILCIYHDENKVIAHYVLYVGNIVGNYMFLTLGENGFFRQEAFIYKKVIGFNLTPDLWKNGFFIYDRDQKKEDEYKIARIEYDLLNML